MSKEVSSTSFVVSHVIVILFHIILGAVILYGLNAKKYTLIKWMAYLLILVSALGLIPIFMNTSYVIS